MFRGGGVEYKEILIDVCDKLEVNYNKGSSIETIEQNLMMKVIADSMEKLSESERKEVLQELDIKSTDFTGQAVTLAIRHLIKSNGLLYYKIALIVANNIARTFIGRGISFAGNIALVRSMSIFAGPIGLIITSLWTALDIAGPAYRVTIPVVIEIAYLRAKLNYS
jgi:uncharacterized protein YaaW (UPF0174 family)